MAHDPKVKARAIALRLSGKSIGQTADELGLTKSTVANWEGAVQKALAEVENNTPSTVSNTAPQVQILANREPEISTISTESGTQKRSRAELLGDLIDAQLEALIAQLHHSKDKEWLKRQSADGLALLFGIQMDKAVKMLEIMERSRAQREKLAVPAQPGLPLEGGDGA